MKSILFLAVLSFSLSSFAADAKPDCKSEARYEEISKADLKTLVEKKEVFVIDVNSEESYKDAHVGDAVHYGTVKSEFAKKLPEKKDALIVSYCGGPECTAWKKAAIEACKLGYTNIKHFKAGISGWKKSA